MIKAEIIEALKNNKIAHYFWTDGMKAAAEEIGKGNFILPSYTGENIWDSAPEYGLWNAGAAYRLRLDYQPEPDKPEYVDCEVMWHKWMSGVEGYTFIFNGNKRALSCAPDCGKVSYLFQPVKGEPEMQEGTTPFMFSNPENNELCLLRTDCYTEITTPLFVRIYKAKQ